MIQLYVKAEDSSFAPTNPVLCGFARVQLKAGESKPVSISVPAQSLAVVDDDGNRFFPGGRYSLYAGTSQPDARSRELTGASPVKVELSL